MTFPNMAEAFSGWETQTQFKKVNKTVSDFEVTETTETEYFTGMFYPMKSQDIIFKPEGQRTWKWWNLLSIKSLALDDIVKDANDKQYRVMGVRDWSMAGYFEYDLTEQFQ
jgi:hypothetical protein